MPEYTYQCPYPHRWDLFHVIAECDDEHLCPYCDRPGKRVPQVVQTIGAMPSKPIDLGNAEATFTDNASYRRYMKANPKLRVHSTDSPEWKSKKDKIREKAEVWAKRRGWRDWDQKVATESQARKEGKPTPTAPVAKES